MKKELIQKFVRLYHLNGLIPDSVMWAIKDKSLSTRITTKDKTTMGVINLDKFELDDSEFAVNDAAKVLKLITPLPEEINLTLSYLDTTPNALLAEGLGKAKLDTTITLADKSTVDKVAHLKKVPDFNLEFDLDEELMTLIISVKNSVPESKTLTFTTEDAEDGQIKMIFGYISDISTDRTAMNIPVTFLKDGDILYKSFSAESFKNILLVNKGFKTGKIRVFAEGLLNLVFEHEFALSDTEMATFTAEYYLVQLKNV